MDLLEHEAQHAVIENVMGQVRQGYGSTVLVSGEASLIPGARIVSAANAVEYLASGAASLSF